MIVIHALAALAAIQLTVGAFVAACGFIVGRIADRRFKEDGFPAV